MQARGVLCSLLLVAAASTDHAQTQPATQPLSSIPGPTLITLRLDKVPAKEAFDRLEQVSKMHLATMQPDLLNRNDQLVSADFKETPYLSAVLDLCGQTNLQLNVARQLMLMPSPNGRKIPPHVATGPMIVFCNGATRVQEVRYGEHERTTASALLNLSLITEPNSPLMGIDGPAFNVTAIDDHGHVLKPPVVPVAAARPIGVIELPNTSRFLSIQLALAPDSGRVLTSVGGSVITRMISKVESLTIKDVLSAQGQAFRLGDSTFTVTHVQEVGIPGQYQIDLDVQSEALSATFFARMQIMDSPFVPRTEPANIMRLQPVQIQNGHPAITLLLTTKPRKDGDKPAVDLVWPLPANVARVEVPFEFHDLKLPG